jgi:hypothetical protein
MRNAADVELQARLRAASVEVSHLEAIVTHPWTRTELASIESMLRRCIAATHTPEDAEAVLEAARLRLRTIHDAVAAWGPNVAVSGDVK